MEAGFGDERTIVLGSHNLKKLRELQLLLRDLQVTLLTLSDFPSALQVEETGATFSENAALKATQQAVHLDHWVLGEDSGLSVDALDGEPGVYSSRFSGPEATDAANNAKLVELLKPIPPERRTAFYTCHMTLSNPQGQVQIDIEEYCSGRIVTSPRGEGGFGYDPLFELPEYHQTFGELGDSAKSLLSHRARAMRQFRKQLARLSSWDVKRVAGPASKS